LVVPAEKQGKRGLEVDCERASLRASNDLPTSGFHESNGHSGVADISFEMTTTGSNLTERSKQFFSAISQLARLLM
jgi:hypothetical protein